jgi:hypothetical protein
MWYTRRPTSILTVSLNAQFLSDLAVVNDISVSSYCLEEIDLGFVYDAEINEYSILIVVAIRTAKPQAYDSLLRIGTVITSFF